MKIGADFNLRQNEIQNVVFQNLIAAPENPKLGQAYFDSTLGKYGLYEGTNGENAHWSYFANLEDLQAALDALGTMAYEDKNDYYTKQDIVDHFWSNNDKTLATGHFKVETDGTNGKAIVWNEETGGGAQFINKDGTESFIGVNDGGIASGDKKLVAQIYADKKVGDNWVGAKLDVTNEGMYYTVGGEKFAQRAVDANEIATHGTVNAEAQARQQADEALKQEVLTHLWNNNTAFDTGFFRTETTSSTGTAALWNEASGGGAQYIHQDGTESFVGVNNGGENGLVAQIYADKLVNGKWQGAKLDVTNGGMYYTVGNKSFAERAITENEVATKGNVATSVNAEQLRAEAAEADLLDKIGIEQGRAEAAEQALDEAKADKATTLAGYNIQDAYTKSEIDAKMASAFHYKGSVDYYAELPEYGNVEGDVWNIKYADPDHGVDAGDNVVWVAAEDESDESGLGGYWDVLAGIMDLSAYAKKTEVQALEQELNDFKNNLKVAELNPAIEVGASGYATWTVPHTHGEDVVVTVKEVSTKEEILVNVIQNYNSVTIGVNAEPNSTLAAGTYKVIIVG